MISSMDELKKYCQLHQNEISTINGDCQGCLYYKKCRSDRKNFHIQGFRRMDKARSRFPRHVVSFFDKHPHVLEKVPAIIFQQVYGNKDKSKLFHDKDWGCIFQGKTIIAHLDQVSEIYDMLETDDSKQAYLNVLMYRLTADTGYILRAYTEEPQYFIKEFQNGEGYCDVYVDGGAYTGDTFLEYCKYNTPPKKAYLFEPDGENMSKLLENVESFRSKTEIITIQKGLYSRETELYFTSGKETSSSFSEEPGKGSEKIGVTSIDDSITESVDFIKMDIEAFEPFALQGAKQTILRSYPKLAICIYHHTEHLWEIPLLIKIMYPEYIHFQVRHHRRYYADTVLYVYK